MADKWFNEKMDTKKLRSYTKTRIDPDPFQKLSKVSRQYSVTTWLIIINIITFIIAFLLREIFGEEILQYIAIQPNLFFSGYVWTLITSMFMHAGLGHLFLNLITLFFIGNFVEKLIGRKRYFWLYLISGIVAGLFFVFLAFYFGSTNLESFAYRIFGSPGMFAVGASGAIFALVGILAVLAPKIKFLIFFIIPMRAWFFATFFFIFFWMISASANWPIANTAHLGGLLAGALYAFYLKKRYRKKTAMIQKYFS